MQNKKSKIMKFKKEVETLRKTIDPEKFEDKLEQLKNKEVKAKERGKILLIVFIFFLRLRN